MYTKDTTDGDGRGGDRACASARRLASAHKGARLATGRIGRRRGGSRRGEQPAACGHACLSVRRQATVGRPVGSSGVPPQLEPTNPRSPLGALRGVSGRVAPHRWQRHRSLVWRRECTAGSCRSCEAVRYCPQRWQPPGTVRNGLPGGDTGGKGGGGWRVRRRGGACWCGGGGSGRKGGRTTPPVHAQAPCAGAPAVPGRHRAATIGGGTAGEGGRHTLHPPTPPPPRRELGGPVADGCAADSPHEPAGSERPGGVRWSTRTRAGQASDFFNS